MRRLQQLAECYELWAADVEAMTKDIIATAMNGVTEGVPKKQLQWAETLLEKAQSLREEAARLQRGSNVLYSPKDSPETSSTKHSLNL